MGEEVPGGLVTTADLFREIAAMRTELVRAVTQLEMAANTNRDHESRLRTLEAFKWKLAGAVLLGSAAVSAGVALIAAGIH